jgi:C4-dicarboxylate-specific signal transduction histidine kinase/ActR/RegA family two-component response regulator
MRFWRRKEDGLDTGRGVARAALEGATRMELAAEAIHELRAAGAGDRLGVWMECVNYGSGPEVHPSDFGASDPPANSIQKIPGPSASSRSRSRDDAGDQLGAKCSPHPKADAQRTSHLEDRAWRGVVWDRESETSPVEWEHLSSEAPLPQELLVGGKLAEQELQEGPQNILIGVLMELRKVLWVPITSRGRLRGVLLCGTKERQRTLEPGLPKRLAAELALQLEWEDERVVARERYEDIALARRLQMQLASGGQSEAVLACLADGLADVRPGGSGIGAAFAMIGTVTKPSGEESAAATVDFRWRSGDADWLQTAQGETVTTLWQEVLRTRRMAGIDPHVPWMHMAISRIVAVPLEAEGEVCGVLVAGLLRRGSSLAALERLEYRATLAGLAIATENRERARRLAAQRQRAYLETTRECLFVLDEDGRILETSLAAAELTLAHEPKAAARQRGAAASTVAFGASHLTLVSDLQTTGAGAVCFTSLFDEHVRTDLQHWLRRSEPGRVGTWNTSEDAIEVELRDRQTVHLRRGYPGAPGQTVVLLEAAGREAASPSEADAELALHSVIEWLEEGVVLFDAQERVRAFNGRFEQLAGLPPSESAKGATLEKLLARMKLQAADPEKFDERWRELARGIESGVRDELRMLQPTPRILERAARPVLDAAGRKIGRVEIYRDLTAQRMFQSQLLQTEKLAALGQMMTGVAHELSNPLTSVLGYAQRLLLREESSGRMPEVRQIFQEAERASAILRQLLVNARETPPERRRTSLNQVIMRSMELQRFSFAAEQVRVELDLDPGLPFVMGDGAQLQQVLMNLVGNARQAIQQQGRGGRIRIRTKQIAERTVQLEVEDDGPGVPRSILARIFDPFFTTKAADVGTGLGLCIVLSIVREHGGRVNVLDAPEGGAIFSIELPTAEVLAATLVHTAGNFALVDLPPAVGEPNLGESRILAKSRAPMHANVLVVEDEPTVARLIADVLQDEGCTVEVLLGSREGLRRAAERSFDLAICDMRMPGLDGQQFYQSLVRSGNALQHSFLFVTGDVIAPGTHAFLERNQLPHLAKPFRVEELTELVRSVLGKRSESAGSMRAAASRSGAGKDTAG